MNLSFHLLQWFMLLGVAIATLLDLTHTVHPNTLRFPIYSPFKITKDFKASGLPFYFAYREFSMPDHIGTHIDAFSHFVRGGQSVDKIPLKAMFLNAILIDISKKVKKDRTYLLNLSDLKFSKKELKCLCRPNAKNLLLIRTGLGKFWRNKKLFFGTDSDNMEDFVYPGVSETAAYEIMKQCFTHVATDFANLDGSKSTTFIAHQTLLGNGVYIIENVKMDKLPPREFLHVYAFPSKIGDATGAQIRMIARLTKVNGKKPLRCLRWSL